MCYQRLACLFIGTFLIGFSSIIAAAPANQLEAVKVAAEEYVTTLITPPAQGELNVQAGNLDARLRLSNCPSPLDVSVPGRQSLNKSVTVMVTCEEDDWQVYVPVQISLLTPVVVAKRPLDRGVMLTNDDLTVQLVDARFQRGQTYTEVSTVVGSRIKRVVGIGQPVQGNDICMVCRSDEVVITATGSGLNIIAKGTALSDGALGEQIKVRNSKSNRIVDATITSVGQVIVKF
ncbi:flagella basal body P-ring formation protein FlgA [Enterovibrio norvegicus]|uniref:flagellar basal body P-ring formation chaperone FlgA n=1 Tax=Enterovibrio norvegicus TaxID=188144 RepID=UPI000C8655F2|nr:flagellar basal body P-ring formation chaperone FlgA [Enterovibrio norvegicus]MCC4798968.1 flagellar basal body P-ring formation protein FlgA [Enterovibrio norvegicus]PMI29394.1 flagella basal body P-ring formation protein FlgA [Enterovibrio norvegicus]PMI37827.1 flagella basal body P-ring formation protein FlgA [Enterovibrio norvegicus]PMN46416.1 flagella basal body P-ring formation protein FlgA [Enterovibrio norvegicus]TKF10907.1 flagellar basal body P-ring formation protein FlgA [Enterov